MISSSHGNHWCYFHHGLCGVLQGRQSQQCLLCFGLKCPQIRSHLFTFLLMYLLYLLVYIDFIMGTWCHGGVCEAAGDRTQRQTGKVQGFIVKTGGT